MGHLKSGDGPVAEWSIAGSETGNFRNHFRNWLLVTKISRPRLLGCADEADSFAGWVAGGFDFAGRGGTLGGVALSVFGGGGCGGGVCESGGEDFFCYFGISDYDSVVERVWQDLDDWVAGILCAAGLPDFAGGDCIYGAGVCDFLA